MNTQIIAIANQKGGVGKTTTCANLGIGLAQAGKKVLLIDGDPQGSLTISLGHPQPDKLPFTLSDAMGRILMDEPLRPGEGILHHPEGVDLMPADIQLSGMEVSLVNAMSRETILRQYLDTLKGQYSHSEMLRKFHIAPTKKVKELSKGMQMKLMLACAFSYDAKLLILDEPTSGLDPVSRDELLQILSEYIEDGEHSVLFSTHITGDLERAADYITYISYGELFFTGSKDEFVDMFRIVKGGMDELSADLQAKAVGVRTFPTGFEALVKTEDIGSFTALDIEPATIDEIVVFTSKKGEDYE